MVPRPNRPARPRCVRAIPPQIASGQSVRSSEVSILGWIVVGFIAGALATRITRYDRRGCLFSIIVGIIGALIGGALFSLIGDRSVLDEFDLESILVALIGSVLFLLVLKAIERR
jgi:uncharacterized membrane protein YeaQ/YmgE (transglycosylase-associated protein family)